MTGGYYVPQRYEELRSAAMKLWTAVDDLLESDGLDNDLWDAVREAHAEVEEVLEP